MAQLAPGSIALSTSPISPQMPRSLPSLPPSFSPRPGCPPSSEPPAPRAAGGGRTRETQIQRMRAALNPLGFQAPSYGHTPPYAVSPASGYLPPPPHLPPAWRAPLRGAGQPPASRARVFERRRQQGVSVGASGGETAAGETLGVGGGSSDVGRSGSAHRSSLHRLCPRRPLSPPQVRVSRCRIRPNHMPGLPRQQPRSLTSGTVSR